MNSTACIMRWWFQLLFLLAVGLDRPSFSVEALINRLSKSHSDVSFSSIPLSLAEKYGSLPMSRKELINELQGLGRKATKLQQNWRFRANRYFFKKPSESEEAQPSPIIIPVNPKYPPEAPSTRLAFLQLRDCVFVGSSCASPRKMDPSQTSKYMDQMEAILGANGVEIENKSKQRGHALTFV
ncbi:hypothetical protein FO519_002044 [Halicephalobus sp. NKZ332]|nr:hypothetical protein FO519_002044 [Halicephalobus sp. NKZ332]